MKYRIFALAVLASLAVPAASIGAEDDIGAWVSAGIAGPLPASDRSSNWRYTADLQVRHVDTERSVTQWAFRPSVGLRLSDSLEARIGFWRFENDRQGARSSNENRLWQQLSWTAGRALDGTWSVRTRLEQRSPSTGDDLGLRLRLMAKYVRPFENRGDRYFVGSFETLANLRDTDWGADSGIDQNRLYLGVGHQLNAQTSVEIAYMLQGVVRDNSPDQNNHLAMVSFTYRP